LQGTKKGLLYPVSKDQRFIDELKEILSSKFFGSILPEIVSRRSELNERFSVFARG